MEGVSGARPAIQTVGNGIEFILTVDRKVRAFGQILSQQPVGVFAGAPLPWTVRVAEVHFHAGRGGELFMSRHFFALVVGEALPQWLGNRIEFGGEARQRRSGGGIFHLRKQHQAAGPFDQNAYRGLVACALDEVAFPVPRQHPVLDFRRPHMNTDHARNLSAPVCASCTRHARAVTMAQAGNELSAQFAARLGVDGRVDGFVRNLLGRVSRIHTLECARYLLG